MLLTDDPTIADRARLLRNLAFEPGRRFRHERLGFNFRITNLQAALAIPQIERMDKIVAKKRWIAAEYTRLMRDIPGLQLPFEEPWARSVYWMCGIATNPATGIVAEAMGKRLSELGVESRPFFLGLHEQPVFRRAGWFTDASFPVTERLARHGLYLPSGIGLSSDQLEHVVGAVRRVLA